MVTIFPINFSTKMGSVGLVTQSIIGIGLFPILVINALSDSPLIPKNYAEPLFAYVGYLIVTLLFASISGFRNSKVSDKKCHYCGGDLEVSKFKCKSPLCGKEQ